MKKVREELVDTQESPIERSNKHKNLKIIIVIFVVLMMLSFIFLSILVSNDKKMADMSPKERKAKMLIILKKIQDNFPEFSSMVSELSNKSKAEIEKIINEQVDVAYAPLYYYIDDVSAYHYSLKGEYSEIASLVFSKMTSVLEKKMFEPANFDSRINNALNEINIQIAPVIKQQSEQLKQGLHKKVRLSDDEANYLVTEIMDITNESLENRFFNNLDNNLFKFGASAISGIGTAKIYGQVRGKVYNSTSKIESVAERNIAKKVGEEIIVKAGAKGAAKTVTAGEEVGAGALAGAVAGAEIGPGAVVTGFLGAGAGLVMFIVTDKATIEIDKYTNSKKFKQSLKDAIDKSKLSTTNTIDELYMSAFKKLTEDNVEKFNKMKQESTLEIIKSNNKKD